MADKFGASHRELIQDTNEGRIEPPQDTTIRSSTGGGRSTQIITNSDKPAIYTGLLKVGEGIVGGMVKRQKEQDYLDGFNHGLDEGFLENARSPLRDLLFGPNATLRGAQERIVDNSSNTWFRQRLSDMEGDMKSFDSNEYQTHLTDGLNKMLEKQTDPEIKGRIAQAAVKNFESLARNHAQARQAWVDQTNDKVYEDGIDGSIARMQTAHQFGDLKTQQDAQERADIMFSPPIDMDPNVWLETTNRVIIKHLSKGSDIAYRQAMKQGIIDTMRPSEQMKLKTAYAVYDKNNGRRYMTAANILEARMKTGDATDADLRAFKSQYPEQGPALNDLREAKLKADGVLADERAKRATAQDLFISGDVQFNSLTPKLKTQAMTDTFNDMANNALSRMRDKAIDNGTFTGDPEASFTPTQRQEYMLDNPMEFAQQWAMHPEVPAPMLQNLGSSIVSDIRSEHLDQPGVEQLQRKMEALQQFRALDETHFNSQFRSEEEAQIFSVYSYLVNDAHYNPINAARELRTIQALDPIDIKDQKYQAQLDDNVGTLADNFLDNSPESQGVLGLYNKTPDNEQAFNYEVRSRLTDALKMFKGDMSKALPAANAALRRNGIVSNGQFIPNGAKLQIKGGTVEEFIRGINGDAEMRSQITNSGNGFPADADYTAMELSINPWKKDAVILHSRHEITGQPISISVNLPQRGEDFKPYGMNSFTGFNPKIADTEERKKAFIRNNWLLKTNRRISDAMHMPIEPPYSEYTKDNKK